MADIKWIKITTDVFDDEKILLIEALPSADGIIVIWFKLLTFAGKQNNNGVFMLNDRIAYTDDMLAAIFRRDVAIVRQALDTFEQLGMIERYDNVITIPNWSKHQSLDAYSLKKARDREYQAKRRAAQKALAEKSSDSRLTSDDSSSDVAPLDKDIDKEEERIDKSIRKGNRKRFTPPTIEEVTAYCRERGNSVDPEAFIAYYEARDWVLSNGRKMAKWKSAVITWEKRDKAKEPEPPKAKRYPCPICGRMAKQKYDKSCYCYTCHKEF